MTKYIAIRNDLLFSRITRSLREKVMQLSGNVNKKIILEVAPGTGNQAALYAQSGAIYTGIDLSPEMVERAKKKLDGQENIEISLGNATKLPYENNHFDLATVTLALHEMKPETRNKVLEEMIRVTKGPLVIADYSAEERNPFNDFAIRIIERLAGKEHYQGYKHFMANGGVHSLVKQHNLKVEEELFFAGRNIAILRLAK